MRWKQLLSLLRDQHGYKGASTPDEVCAFILKEGIDVQDSTGKAIGVAEIVQSHAKAMIVTVEDTDTGATASGEVTSDAEPVQAEDEPEEEKMEEDEDGAAPAKSMRRKRLSDISRAAAPAVLRRDSDGHRYEQKIKTHGVGKERRQAKFHTYEAAAGFGAAVREEAFRKMGVPNPHAASDRDILRKTGTTTNLNSAGALIAGDFSSDIIYIKEEFGVARKAMGVTPMSEGTKLYPRSGGNVSTAWQVEGSAYTNTDLNVDNVELTARTLGGICQVSNELLNDSAVNIGDQVAMEFAQDMANKEDKAAFNGDGTSTYGNFVGFRPALLGVDGTIGNIAGLTVGSGAWSAFTVANIEAMQGTLPHYAGYGQPEFACHKAFFYNVLLPLFAARLGTTFTDLASQSLLATEGTDYDFNIQGTPGRFVQVMPSATATSSIPLLYGHFDRAGKFGEVSGGVQLATSEHALFTSNAFAFRATERVGVNVHDVGDTSTAGPVVGLITSA